MLFVGLAGTAVAEDRTLWRDDLVFGFDVTSEAKRESIARALAHRMLLLKAFLPSLTADQKKWLEKERAVLQLWLTIYPGLAFKFRSGRKMKDRDPLANLFCPYPAVGGIRRRIITTPRLVDA